MVDIDIDGEKIARITWINQDKHQQLLRRHQTMNRKGQEINHGTRYNLERQINSKTQ